MPPGIFSNVIVEGGHTPSSWSGLAKIFQDSSLFHYYENYDVSLHIYEYTDVLYANVDRLVMFPVSAFSMHGETPRNIFGSATAFY